MRKLLAERVFAFRCGINPPGRHIEWAPPAACARKIGAARWVLHPEGRAMATALIRHVSTRLAGDALPSDQLALRPGKRTWHVHVRISAGA